MTFFEEAKPLYSCYHYKDDFYKIVKFKRSNDDFFPSTVREDPSVNEKAGDRFLSSLSRSRSSVLTIDGSRHDRFNLDSFLTRFTQFIRDLRKKYGCKLLYLLVPEKHKDGAWHIHGLLSGLPGASVVPFIPGVHPDKLIGKYLNWTDYSDKFGFCSLGHIQDPVIVAVSLISFLL